VGVNRLTSRTEPGQVVVSLATGAVLRYKDIHKTTILQRKHLMRRDEVIKNLEENREAIKRFGVRSIGLFGSCARGEEGETSDLDFLVELEEKTFDAYMGLKEFLEGLFGCKVDLVLEDTLKPRLRSAIMKEVVHAPGL